MKAIDFTIWKTIFEMDLLPAKFNGLDPKEQAAIFNTLRFAIKEQTPPLPAETRARVHRGIEKRIGEILFD